MAATTTSKSTDGAALAPSFFSSILSLSWSSRKNAKYSDFSYHNLQCMENLSSEGQDILHLREYDGSADYPRSRIRSKSGYKMVSPGPPRGMI